MKKLLIILISLASCSKLSLNIDGDLNDYQTISKSIISKIENMKIDSAVEEYNTTVKNEKQWCLTRYSSNQKCRKKSQTPPSSLALEIKKAKDCSLPLTRCQNFSNFRKEDLKSCVSDLKKDCKVRDKWDSSYPNAYNKLIANIEDKIPNAKLGSIKMSTSQQKRVDECAKNWVWSFNRRVRKYNKNSFHYNTFGTPEHTSYGKYSSYQECNLKRKETSTELRYGLYGNDKCFKRYIGIDFNFCRNYL